MPIPAKPTALEHVTGSVVTEAALTGLAAYVGGPLAALVPPLTKSLAAGRQLVRVQSALDDVARVLEKHSAEIERLTDEQYQLITEAVAAMLQTTHQEKLVLLRTVIENSFCQVRHIPAESTVLSRIIRDISPEEADFLHRAFAAEGVMLHEVNGDESFQDEVLRVPPASPDAISISGLLSLGLLIPFEPTYDAMNVMRFTPLAAKLLALVRKR